MMSPTPSSSAYRRTPARSSSFSTLTSPSGKSGTGAPSSSSPSVILEFGSSFLRVGYSSSHAPRAILPSTLPFPNPSTTKITTEEEWENVLYPLLSEVYTSSLHLKHAKSKRVLILEPYISPNSFRVAVCRVLLSRLGVSSVLFVPGGCMSVVPYGLGGKGEEGVVGGGNKVVLDIGTWECRVVACVGTKCLMDTFQAVPCGFDSFVQYVMNEHNHQINNDNDNDDDTQKPKNTISSLNDAKYIVSNCLHHLSPLSSNILKDNENDDTLTVTLQSSATLSTVTISLQLIQQCLREYYLDVSNPDSLAYALLTTLIKCPIDLRKSMIRSLVMVGGGVVSIPGFERLFGKALLKAFQNVEEYEMMDSRFKPLKSAVLKDSEGAGGLGIIYPLPFAPHLMSFVGGCVMGTLGLMDERWIHRRVFEEHDDGNGGDKKVEGSILNNVIHDFLSAVSV